MWLRWNIKHPSWKCRWGYQESALERKDQKVWCHITRKLINKISNGLTMRKTHLTTTVLDLYFNKLVVSFFFKLQQNILLLLYYVIKLSTRMHSSRMHTVPSMTISGGGCLPRGHTPPCLLHAVIHLLWTEWLTDRCKNINFPQLSLRVVKKNSKHSLGVTVHVTWWKCNWFYACFLLSRDNVNQFFSQIPCLIRWIGI